MRALSKKDETRLRKILRNSPRDFDPDLFVAKVAVEDEPYIDMHGVDHGPCWCWCASLSRNGYGRFRIKSLKTSIGAHRLVAEAMVGRVLKKHEFACHHCDNPRCANPDHIYVGSQTDNMRDAAQKGRLKFPDISGEKNSQSKLTWEEVREIRTWAQAGYSQKAIAEAYAASPQTVCNIVNNQAWIDPNADVHQAHRYFYAYSHTYEELIR